MSGQLAKVTPEPSVEEPKTKLDAQLANQIACFLPDEREQSAFAGALVSAFRKNPKIGQCTKESILACVRDCAMLDLQPNTPLGLAYLIPRGNVLGLEIGYKGYAHLLYRDGAVKKIQAGVVHQGDAFEHQLGTGGFVRHTRSLEMGRAARPILCAWVEFTLHDSVAVEIMDSDDLASVHAAMLRQNAGKETPAWKFFGDEMRKKACLKRGVKLLPRCKGGDTFVAKALEIEHAPMLAAPTVAMPGLEFGERKALPPPPLEPADQDGATEGEGWNAEKGEFEWTP